MHNTTMQDKLTVVLGVSKRIAVQSKEALIANARKSARGRSMSGAKRLKAAARDFTAAGNRKSLGSRYVTPPKKQNPFSVHAYLVTEAPLEPSAELQETASAESAQPNLVIEQPAAPELEPVQPEEQGSEIRDQGSAESRQSESALEIPVSEEPPSTVLTTTALSSQEIAEHAAPPAEEPVEPQDEAAVPSVYIPPNLAWLQQPTPFIEPLKFIVDRVRGAKATVNFTLGESLRRQTDLRNQRAAIDERLQQEQQVESEQRQKLSQLDDMISACALMAEQSMTVDVELLTSHPSKKHHEAAQAKSGDGTKPPKRADTKRTRRWDTSDITMCRKEDVLRFFVANPNTNWTAPEIRKQLPAAKQEHAKAYLNVVLSAMHRSSEVLRVGTGIYRAIPTQ